MKTNWEDKQAAVEQELTRVALVKENPLPVIEKPQKKEQRKKHQEQQVSLGPKIVVAFLALLIVGFFISTHSLGAHSVTTPNEEHQGFSFLDSGITGASVAEGANEEFEMNLFFQTHPIALYGISGGALTLLLFMLLYLFIVRHRRVKVQYAEHELPVTIPPQRFSGRSWFNQRRKRKEQHAITENYLQEATGVLAREEEAKAHRKDKYLIEPLLRKVPPEPKQKPTGQKAKEEKKQEPVQQLQVPPALPEKPVVLKSPQPEQLQPLTTKRKTPYEEQLEVIDEMLDLLER